MEMNSANEIFIICFPVIICIIIVFILFLILKFIEKMEDNRK